MIYLDNAATTPVDERVLEAMLPYLRRDFGNPSSSHAAGRAARRAVEEARGAVAAAIGAEPSQLIFTTSGTAASNLAIRGTLGALGGDRGHVVTSAIEHASVHRIVRALGEAGWLTTVLPVTPEGQGEPETLQAALRPDTALVSIMYGNNEIGSLQPVGEIGALCRERGVLFHCDAVQALGHVPLELAQLPVAFMSFSGHKINAPKGVGALFVRDRSLLQPVLTGGGQEQGLWPGTEAVANIVALGAAARLLPELLAASEEMARLRDELIEQVLDGVPGARATGHRTERLPHIASFCFEGVSGDALVMALDQRGICASTGAVCSSGSGKPSRVLQAIGLSDRLAGSSLRLSLGRRSTAGEVREAAQAVVQIVNALRSEGAPRAHRRRPLNPALAGPVEAGRLDAQERRRLTDEINALGGQRGAVVVAHNAQLPEVQDIADECGGIGHLMRAALDAKAGTIVSCGVSFMAELIACLRPDVMVLNPSSDARCPMRRMVSVEDVRELRAAHPDAPVVACAKTGPEVIAEADICCTPDNAVAVVGSPTSDQVIMVPDRNLAAWVQSRLPEAEVIAAEGYCPPHRVMTLEVLEAATRRHPDLLILAHPHCSREVLGRADFIGGSDGMVEFARRQENREMLVVSECGLVHRLRREQPQATFHAAPQMVCATMKRVGRREVRDALRDTREVVSVDPGTAHRAAGAINRMLEVVASVPDHHTSEGSTK
ncbi:MAG: quinolinate synthase NadA [Armatimonadota bacterium]|nr:quinolinate synthase NadA [Armatimonadota bacterium]